MNRITLNVMFAVALALPGAEAQSGNNPNAVEVTMAEPSGNTLKISGRNFGNAPGVVMLATQPLQVIGWNDGYINAALPAALISGTYQLVVVKNQGQGNETGSRSTMFRP